MKKKILLLTILLLVTNINNTLVSGFFSTVGNIFKEEPPPPPPTMTDQALIFLGWKSKPEAPQSFITRMANSAGSMVSTTAQSGAHALTTVNKLTGGMAKALAKQVTIRVAHELGGDLGGVIADAALNYDQYPHFINTLILVKNKILMQEKIIILNKKDTTQTVPAQAIIEEQ